MGLDELEFIKRIGAKLGELKRTLLCPLHGVSEPLVGTRFNRLEFDLLEFEGISPASLLTLKILEEELVRCPKSDCHFNSVWHCPLCRFWRVCVDPDSRLPSWKCTSSFGVAPCPFRMTLPLDQVSLLQ